MSETRSEQNSLVTYRREGGIGFISLNRPDKRNAMNLALWDALGAAVDRAAEDEQTLVVILRGEGKSFCAGLDLSPENELSQIISRPPDASQKTEVYRVVRGIQEVHGRLERLIKPTIAAIHGHCLGGGLELALCCDIRLCSADTVFALPEATLAIITDAGGLQRLPRVVGRGHAREIAFRGHRFNADKALSINLVNGVFENREALNVGALEMAEEIAGNPPLAVQGAKEVLLFDENANLDESLDFNAARSSMIVPSEDLVEAVSAHMQKRKGEFKGR